VSFQAALKKVRRDIEVTCETLLEEQMKLRGKVRPRFYWPESQY